MPAREWVKKLFDENRLCREGQFHQEPIFKIKEEHRWGWRNWQYPLWNALMFQAGVTGDVIKGPSLIPYYGRLDLLGDSA
jgi:hypothetical protein